MWLNINHITHHNNTLHILKLKEQLLKIQVYYSYILNKCKIHNLQCCNMFIHTVMFHINQHNHKLFHLSSTSGMIVMSCLAPSPSPPSVCLSVCLSLSLSHTHTHTHTYTHTHTHTHTQSQSHIYLYTRMHILCSAVIMYTKIL